jgi:hypothetical protein
LAVFLSLSFKFANFLQNLILKRALLLSYCSRPVRGPMFARGDWDAVAGSDVMQQEIRIWVNNLI